MEQGKLDEIKKKLADTFNQIQEQKKIASDINIQLKEALEEEEKLDGDLLMVELRKSDLLATEIKGYIMQAIQAKIFQTAKTINQSLSIYMNSMISTITKVDTLKEKYLKVNIELEEHRKQNRKLLSETNKKVITHAYIVNIKDGIYNSMEKLKRELEKAINERAVQLERIILTNKEHKRDISQDTINELKAQLSVSQAETSKLKIECERTKEEAASLKLALNEEKSRIKNLFKKETVKWCNNKVTILSYFNKYEEKLSLLQDKLKSIKNLKHEGMKSAIVRTELRRSFLNSIDGFLLKNFNSINQIIVNSTAALIAIVEKLRDVEKYKGIMILNLSKESIKIAMERNLNNLKEVFDQQIVKITKRITNLSKIVKTNIPTKDNKDKRDKLFELKLAALQWNCNPLYRLRMQYENWFNKLSEVVRKGLEEKFGLMNYVCGQLNMLYSVRKIQTRKINELSEELKKRNDLIKIMKIKLDKKKQMIKSSCEIVSKYTDKLTEGRNNMNEYKKRVKELALGINEKAKENKYDLNQIKVIINSIQTTIQTLISEFKKKSDHIEKFKSEGKLESAPEGLNERNEDTIKSQNTELEAESKSSLISNTVKTEEAYELIKSKLNIKYKRLIKDYLEEFVTASVENLNAKIDINDINNRIEHLIQILSKRLTLNKVGNIKQLLDQYNNYTETKFKHISNHLNCALPSRLLNKLDELRLFIAKLKTVLMKYIEVIPIG